VDEDEDGEPDLAEGLTIARYLQGDSRYVGAEVDLDFALHEKLWLNLGLDVVDAQLQDGTPLPRIPPLRGRAGLDWRYRNLSLRPEAVFVREQDQVFPTETRTAGYALFNPHRRRAAHQQLLTLESRVHRALFLRHALA
jgi:iron complex outermembrane receptor protein